ncbi:MAG: GTP pyrophosphokinase family protein [Leucobacter sp.]|nr:GTP pyrophosphokinase family protein [Leucobacter sp.]
MRTHDAATPEAPRPRGTDDGTAIRPLTGPIDLSQIDLADIDGRREVRDGLARFLMPYKFAIDEIMTKLRILQEEFTQTGEYNPIEHVSSRLKDPDSIIEKMERREVPLQTELVRETITDIAGVRVVCSFVSDVYRVFELLTAHDDITVIQVKDYIAKPKPTGYRSLHLLLEVPVFLSSGPVRTIVEVQIRTIAMDFWASLEHKIYYKYDREVPEDLLGGLRDAADQACQLDSTMEWLHIAIRGSDRDTLVRRGTDTVLRRVGEALAGEVRSAAAGRAE